MTYEKEYDIMGLKRIKISELTLSDNLKGLYTIGVKLINGVQTSVKVSLEHIQTAYENAVAATKKAEPKSKPGRSAIAVPCQIWQRNTVCVICSKARKIYRALYGCSQAHKVWSSVSNTVSRI